MRAGMQLNVCGAERYGRQQVIRRYGNWQEQSMYVGLRMFQRSRIAEHDPARTTASMS